METIGQVVRATNLRDGYTAICRAVAEHGEVVAPRGTKTREFQSTTIIVEDPYDTAPIGVGRNYVPGIAAVESAQLLAGISLPELTIAISPTFGLFTEDNGLFHGAYGPRTAAYDQFPGMIARLKADPDSRQCVTSIWQPMHDMDSGRRDYPCTLLYHFMIRKDRLIMETVMRSNDVYLGLCYDGFQHSRVQIAVASALGVEPGEYRHHAMSLHLYESDIDKVDQLTGAQRKPEFFPAITGGDWGEISGKAHEVLSTAEKFRLDGLWRSYDDLHLDWYASSMMKAIEKNRMSDA